MSASPSAATWRRVIDQAHEGDPRHLLELLLNPTQTDGPGNAVPGSFTELPQDGELRLAIVRVLLFGPWKGATTVQELMTKTGWGKGKPRLGEHEVSWARVFSDPRLFEAVPGAKSREERIEKFAEEFGVAAETLRKRIDKQRKR
jgi:hypothetical protein